jgi:hypothetical protein
VFHCLPSDKVQTLDQYKSYTNQSSLKALDPFKVIFFVMLFIYILLLNSNLDHLIYHLGKDS